MFDILQYTTMISFLNKNSFTHGIRIGKRRAGFTLVEVLVAIAVITIIGFLPISIVSEHLIKNALTKNRVTAGLLTQEIVEYVRYTRDSDLLDPNGGNWFDTLFDPQPTNAFSSCLTHVDDWTLGHRTNYCTVECFNSTDKATQGECGTIISGNKVYDGSVAGIATGIGTRGRQTDTCDGNRPKADNAFTTTLNVVIPQDDSEVQYAAVVPCISWSDKTGSIRRVEIQETMFEWIQRTN